MFTLLKFAAKTKVLKNLLKLSAASLIRFLMGFLYAIALQIQPPPVAGPADIAALQKLGTLDLIRKLFPYALDRDGLLYIGVVTLIFVLLFIPLEIGIKRVLWRVSNEEEIKFIEIFSIFFDLKDLIKALFFYFLLGLYFFAFSVAGFFIASFMGAFGAVFYIFLLVYLVILLGNAPYFYILDGRIFHSISKSIFALTKNLSYYLMFRLSFLLWDLFANIFPPVTLFYEPYLGVSKFIFINNLISNQHN